MLMGSALQLLISEKDSTDSNDILQISHCDASSAITLSDDAADEAIAAGVQYETGQSLTNWSSTHSCQPWRVYEPSNVQEVLRILEAHNVLKRKIRPVGTALSPNGIGMTENSNTNLLSLAAIDYIEVDKKRNLVTVGAGARVADVLKVSFSLRSLRSLNCCASYLRTVLVLFAS